LNATERLEQTEKWCRCDQCDDIVLGELTAAEKDRDGWKREAVLARNLLDERGFAISQDEILYEWIGYHETYSIARAENNRR